MLRRKSFLFAALVLSAGAALVTGGSTMVANASTPAVASAVNPGGVAHLIGANSQVTGGIHEEESSNWSGWADTDGTFTSVSASWVQPTGTCTSGDQYAAFWVGIDGYSSSTVEQTGSEVDCVGRTAEYYAWWEMYPGGSENYSNTVKPGDHFTASVVYDGGENFTLNIADTTQGWSHSNEQSLGATPDLSSAEVITEAPCCKANGDILNLTDFGTVNYTGATANGEAIGTAALGPEQIYIADSDGRAEDSTTALTGGEAFGNTWIRDN
jgi:hypothetical protein